MKKLMITCGFALSVFWPQVCHASQVSKPLKLLYVLKTQQGLTKDVVTFSEIYANQPLVRVLCLNGKVSNQGAFLKAFYASYLQQEIAAERRFRQSNYPEVGPEYVLFSSNYDKGLESWMAQNIAPSTGMALAFANQQKIAESFPVLPMMNTNVALLEFHKGNLYQAKVINDPYELHQ